MKKRPILRTFGYHYRRKYGINVGKIPLDIGLPCPNRLHGGCIYCQPASFRPEFLHRFDTVATQLVLGKNAAKGRFTKYFGYFQQETVTALPSDQLLPLFSLILEDKDCLGLILSTRPDYISVDLLNPLSALVRSSEKECLIELGLQSKHDQSLKLLNRNHTFADFVNAAEQIQRYPDFELAAHLILGIPEENETDMLDTIRYIGRSPIQALKLHHLQVIAGTPLHRMYEAGKVKIFSQDAYIDLLLTILPMIPEKIVLHRLWATSHPDILIAPKWNVRPDELSQILRQRMKKRHISQGCAV